MINECWLCWAGCSRRASSRAAPAAPTPPPHLPPPPKTPSALPEMTPTRQGQHMEKVKYKLLLKEV